MKTLTKAQRCYIAGLMDADGCISLEKSKHLEYRRIREIIVISNTNLELLNWLKKVTDKGQIRVYRPKSFKRHHKSMGQWRIKDIEAVNLLKQIRPFLIVKRKQCDLVLRFRKQKKKFPMKRNKLGQWMTRGIQNLEDRYDKNFIFLSEMRVLNQKGKK